MLHSSENHGGALRRCACFPAEHGRRGSRGFRRKKDPSRLGNLKTPLTQVGRKIRFFLFLGFASSKICSCYKFLLRFFLFLLLRQFDVAQNVGCIKLGDFTKTQPLRQQSSPCKVSATLISCQGASLVTRSRRTLARNWWRAAPSQAKMGSRKC